MEENPKKRAARSLLFSYAMAGLWDMTGESAVRYYQESGREEAKPATPPPQDAPPQDAPRQEAARQDAAPTEIAPIIASAPMEEKSAKIDEAESLAAAAQNLQSLRIALETYEGCRLKDTARNLVFADGVAEARIMLIGEGPGAEEDAQGLPFVGRSGRLLDQMLAAVGLSRRENVYIANVVPWRPPGNRAPSEEEKAQCRPFLERHAALSGAEILLALGGVAAKEILGLSEGIMRTRGRWHQREIGGRRFHVMATFHPAFLLRQPRQKSLVWRDLLALRARLDGEAAGAAGEAGDGIG